MGNRSKLSEYAKATLGSGNMRSAVVLVSAHANKTKGGE